MAAALMPGSSTDWAQPRRSATRPRRAPAARKMPGLGTPRGGKLAGARRDHGGEASEARDAARRSRPNGRANQAAATAARKRAG